MAETQRSDFPEGMRKGAYEYFLEAQQFLQEKSFYKQVCEEKTTDAAFEQSTSVIGSADATERDELEEYEASNVKEGFTTYALMRNFYKAHQVSKETVDDHQKIKDWVKKMQTQNAFDLERSKNKYVAQFYNYGGKTAGNSRFNNSKTNLLSDPSGNYIYDSKPPFNLSGNLRTAKNGATYYNGLALDIDPANFETLWQLMCITNAYDEDGSEVDVTPDILVVGKGGITFAAQRLLQSTLLPGGSTNDKNVLEGIVGLVATRFATDSDQWTLQVAKKGLVLWTREVPKIDVWEEKRAPAIWTVTEERYGSMEKNFRLWASSNFATT